MCDKTRILTPLNRIEQYAFSILIRIFYAQLAEWPEILEVLLTNNHAVLLVIGAGGRTRTDTTF